MNKKTVMKTIEITHADKIMYPKVKVTKGDLARYYEDIADYMLPYLKDRPLTLHRFPEGIHHNGFYQKNASDYFPDWIKTVNIEKEGGWVNHVVCDSTETLLYLVNQGVVTFHITLSKTDKLDYPDKLIFDLDPPDNNFNSVVKSALILRHFLENELKLKSYPMATGSQGIHVVVPLLRGENFDEVRDFAKIVAKHLAQEHPQEFTTAVRKDKREGKLFLDYLRNSYAQTGVCPFSARALEGAPVATPLAWNELDTQIRSSQAYNICTIFKRLKTVVDPWKSFYDQSKLLRDAKKKLEKLMGNQKSK
jgi:bifunctional non-homologous end joining protein LigD